MKAIGGYFGLELPQKSEYHSGAIKLNTGRNAFEYILKANNYSKLYIPYFTCDAVLEPLVKLGIPYAFYSVDEAMEPEFSYLSVREDEAFLYTNYYGLKDSFIDSLSLKCSNIIIDNAQSFFSHPLPDADTFYSARKFFGVSDGAYLFSRKEIKLDFLSDDSSGRFEHLLKRIDSGAEDGYPDYLKNEALLTNQPIKQMSRLTERILQSIDYQFVMQCRVQNFKYLHDKLSAINESKIQWNGQQIPMVYPLLIDNKQLRSKLIKSKVFVAKYWPNVKEWVTPDTFEYYVAENTLALPIDHRYQKEDLDRVISLLK